MKDLKDATDFMEKLFGKNFGSDKPAPTVQPKTTDMPNVRLFMFQLLNAYVRLVDADVMR